MHNFPAKVFLVFLFTLSARLLFAQAIINDPYSRYGFGTLQPNYFGQSLSMGGVSAAMRDNNNLNVANPASYSGIHITTLESGFKVNFYSLQSLVKEKSVNSSYSYLALGLPLSPKWGMTLGLVPYSNVGYIQSLAGSDPLLGPTTSIYSGQGGLTQAFMGHGFSFIKGLSLGFNVGYVFGNIQTSQSLQFQNAIGNISDTVYNSRTTTTLQFGGFNFEYGMQYTYNFTKDKSLTIGYNGTYSNSIITRENDFIQRYTSNTKGNEVILDTVLTTPKPQSYSYLPSKNAVGLSYRVRNQWLVAADFDYDFYNRVIYNGANPGFQNNIRGAVGAQYTPDITSVSNYLDLIDYRIGFTYGKTYLKIHDQNINNVAFTFGLGVPLKQYTQNQLGAKVNLSFEIGRIGTITSSDVLQKYFNVHIGFVLNQLWFYRYRYQ
jgi:hypothetical protein